MANPKRTTNIAVIIESKPATTVRFTQVLVMVEWKPFLKIPKKYGAQNH